eukprot:PhF_6_TR1411/c0_g1_i2/m.2456
MASPVKRTRDEMETATTPGGSIDPSLLMKLASMQDALNKFIDKKWRENRSLDDWTLAVTLECAELIDSYPWKWWKNVAKPADFDNVKIELVDILHFSLSGLMMMPKESVKDSVTTEGFRSPLAETKNAILTFRQVMRLADTHQFDAVTAFVVLAAKDLDFNLIAYYVAKHTLNHIRQLGGYKEGKYKKVHEGGIEDNVLLHQCIQDVTVDSVMSDFDGVGDKILGRVYDAFSVNAEDRKSIKLWLQANA